VHCLLRKFLSSKKAEEQQAAQFNAALGQQNKQVEKPRATLAQARSYEPSGFGQTGDSSLMPWKINFSQKQRYNEEQLRVFCIPSCYSCTGCEFLHLKMVNLLTLQAILRLFGSRLKEHGDKLTKPEELPVYLHGLSRDSSATAFWCVFGD
jgi:hypothetical protein